MRIVSGKFKSKRINAPKNLPVRPTTDMAKEALFNILNNAYYFEDLKVLDLFAGIGSISFEFASRGVDNITSVDKHPGCIAFLEKTSSELNVKLDTRKMNAFTFLEKTNQKYDIIFADPPYDFSEEKFLKIAQLVFNKNLLEDEGVLIIEHSSQTNLSSHHNFTKQKKYGGNLFSFFEN